MTSTLPASPPRIPQLDGIRGLAILMVVLYHYVAVAIPADANAGLLALRQALSNAWSGVDLFFILSGYLIAGILIDNRASSNYFRVFYARRASRIFPVYYFFLLLFLCLRLGTSRLGLLSQGLFDSPLPPLSFFLHLQNFVMAAYGTFGNEFLAITWSLAIEEHFYLLLPLTVRWSPPRKLPLNLLFLFCLSLALRAMSGAGKFHAFVLTPWRLDGLCLGAFLAILFRSPAALEFVRARLRWVWSAFAVLLLYAAYSSITEPLGSLDHLLEFGLLYAGLTLLSLVGDTVFARAFCWPPLMGLGQISYGVYLFHQLVNGVIHDLIFKRTPSFHDLATALATLLALVLTWAVAKTTYAGFEKRFIALGHRQRYARR